MKVKNDGVLVEIDHSRLSKQVAKLTRSGTGRVPAYDIDAVGVVYGAVQGSSKFAQNVLSEGWDGDFDGVLLKVGGIHSEEGAHV